MELRPYQVEGVQFLQRAGRAILADEPGLGKTATVLEALNSLGARDVLIVCPKVAAGVWEVEAQNWIGTEVQHFHGTSRRKTSLDHGYVTTNYSLLKEALQGRHYDAIVWDEFHRQLRNRKAKTRFMLADRYASSGYMYFLSGSPIAKNAGNIWPPLYLIDRKKFRSYWKFVQRFAEVWMDEYGWHVEGVLDERELREYLQPYMLRRLKTDVLTELPEKVRQFVPIEMSPKQRKLYRELTKDMVAEMASGELLTVPSKLALTTRLRQLLVHPALLGFDVESPMLEAIRETIVEEELDKVAIYTPFTKVMPLVEDRMPKEHNIFRIVGGMSEREIRLSVQQFEAEPRAVLLVSLQSATSFTAVSTARPFFLGYDWEPEIMTQAEDRHHRIGQTSTVFPTYYVHRNTLDQHVQEVLDGKTTIQRLILDPQLLLHPSWGT